MAKNVIVSNRLPLQITKLDNSFEFIPTSGGLATGMNSVHKDQESLWIGWPGINDEQIDNKSWGPLKKSLKKEGFIPVSLNNTEIENFYFALIFLGIGWNFGFIGSTAMLTSAHSAQERGKIQGFNDLAVFGLVAFASFSSGGLMNCTATTAKL